MLIMTDSPGFIERIRILDRRSCLGFIGRIMGFLGFIGLFRKRKTDFQEYTDPIPKSRKRMETDFHGFTELNQIYLKEEETGFLEYIDQIRKDSLEYTDQTRK